MQQYPRPSPRSATPATNPITNPDRTNNPRDSPPRRNRSSADLASYGGRSGGQPAGMASRNEGAPAAESQDKENTRLNQIISHFHTKAALTICSSRANLPQVILPSGEIRQDRWFNLLLDETDILQDDLYQWKRLVHTGSPAPPLELEIFLDTSSLSSNQALVLVDDSGKRWDVADALSSSADSSPRLTKTGARYCEVVLERWTMELGDPAGYGPDELNDLLPNVYKKGVVFFRSLFTFLRFLPSWKLYRKLSRQPGSHQSLRLKFRIREQSHLDRIRKDALRSPLSASEHRSDSVVEHHEFPPIFTPSGPLRCSVEYRRNCAFTIADAESLLSSRFLGLEESIPAAAPAGRSLPSSHTDRARERYSRLVAGEGEQPQRERPRALLGAYGSLGTYHATDKTGSPVTELRQRVEQAEEEEAEEEMSSAYQGRTVPESQPRRISVSLRDNPPFKAGSIASSPKFSPRPSPSPGTSTGKYESSFLRIASTTSPAAENVAKRIPLKPRPQPTSRTASSVPNETAVVSSGSTSPRPAPVRYSSSFANRHKRFMSGGSKTADSNASSGRASSSSKEKSGQLNEGGSSVGGAGAGAGAGSGGAPLGSLPSGPRSDDDDIAAFISQLETTDKDLKAFRRSSGPPLLSGPSSSSSSRNTPLSTTSMTATPLEPLHPPIPHIVNLAKFSSIRDTNAQLAEEMSSSSLIQAGTTATVASSTTPPSRRLSNVPGLSTSSSPSRAQAHVPYVRSRLSTHSIAEEVVTAVGGGVVGSGGGVGGVVGAGRNSPVVRQVEEIGEEDGLRRRAGIGVGEGEDEDEEDEEPFIFQQDNV